MRERTIKKQFWINQDEENLLKSKSKRAGLNESEFLRSLIKGYKIKEQPTKEIRDFIKQISPDLIGAGRLLASLRTNNKISDVVRKSIKPVLKDTYELYSPVTGAFSEMELRNN